MTLYTRFYRWFAFLVLLCGCSRVHCQVNEWHSLEHLTTAQKASASYKFLVRKFGPDGLITECDAEEAALLGGDYLFQVGSIGNSLLVGETVGHGASLQAALNDAAAHWLSPAQVKAFNAEMEQDEKAERKREAEYAKKCCKP